MAKNNQANKTKANKAPVANGEEAIFGGNTSGGENLGQTGTISAGANIGVDLATGKDETVTNITDGDDIITDNDLPVADLPSEGKVFGGQEEVFEEANRQGMVSVPQDTLANILNELNTLKAKVDGGDDPVSLLKNTKKEKQVRISYFIDPETAETFIFNGIVKIKLPTGTIVSTFRKPTKDMDGTTKVKDHMRVSLINVETGVQTIKDVISEEFRAYLTSKYYLVKSEKSEDVDMTPADETVYQMSYVENDRYLKRVETGALVKTEVQGKMSYYTIDVEGKVYEFPQDVINFN